MPVHRGIEPGSGASGNVASGFFGVCRRDSRLDQSLLVELLRQLLHVEAESAGILRSGIHVPAQINVADGGEDGRIEWFEGPDHTRFLPCRLVQFQVKATDMPPAKCAGEMREKDGSVKERILSTIKAGGTYVIFCNRPCTQAMIDERIARMRQVLNNEEAGLASIARLDFWDANRIADWANSHYPVALWVIGAFVPVVSSRSRLWKGGVTTRRWQNLNSSTTRVSN